MSSIQGEVVAITWASSALGEATARHLAAKGARVQSELPLGSSDPETAAGVKEFYRTLAIPADAVTRAIAFAVEQPADVDVNEILLRPTAQEL